jgi:hypothetical protein
VENELDLTEVATVDPPREPAIQIEFFDFQTQVAWPCLPL